MADFANARRIPWDDLIDAYRDGRLTLDAKPADLRLRKPHTDRAPRPAPFNGLGGPDPRAVIRRRLDAPHQATSIARRSIGHPGFAESLIPVWGSGREAVADFQEGDYAGAALNGALAASDLFLAGSIAKGVGRGAFYVAKNASKKPYDWDRYVRPWLGGERGMLARGQHGHHWAIPQGGWGKGVPDWLKNQPWNIKPMPKGPAGAEMHGRMTGSYKGKSQFNPVERYVHGTPAWAKVGTGSAVGHPVAAGKAREDRRR